MSEPTTLQEAIVFYADPENCLRKLVSKRWPDGVVICPTCGSKSVHFNAKRRTFKCGSHHPRREFSVKVGTIFEDSPLPLSKWLTALWMIVNCKNGISSWENHRALGVTQKTAWFMGHRIRLAMQEGTFEKKLLGEVEADETFIGGLARNMHKDKRVEKINHSFNRGKVAVMGLLERHGEVRLKVMPNVRKSGLQAQVREHVEPGAEVFTDALLSYEGLDADYIHQVIDHAEAYARGNVHTNGLENFWSLLKRGIRGTYVSVESFHLFRYLDEQAFRFNYRKDMDDSERFNLALSQIVGKRLTYKQLTGKTLDDARQEN
ncbi:MAG TPA: IS1595 family transposase [Terriglobia bacterium]|jgi:transposase-like protein|nr:IS1595 family transposase [Terriglobia bacterium]